MFQLIFKVNCVTSELKLKWRPQLPCNTFAMCRHVAIDIFNLFQTTNHNQQESIHFIITAFFFLRKNQSEQKNSSKELEAEKENGCHRCG